MWGGWRAQPLPSKIFSAILDAKTSETTTCWAAEAEALADTIQTSHCLQTKGSAQGLTPTKLPCAWRPARDDLLQDLLLSHSLLSSWLCRNPPAQDCPAELIPNQIHWLDFVWKNWKIEGISSWKLVQ